MLKIGLTGGIGSGKTTAAQLFANFNVPIIDADVIAHQITQAGEPALKSIIQKFGNDIITADGCLDRAKLRAIVFSDADKKLQLESLLHPLIYAQIEIQLAQLKTAYCIICIPLLIETKKTDFVDRILLIDCSVETQIQRVKNRNQLTDSQIHAIIASQAQRAERLAVADDVIDNSISSSHLAEQVKKLHTSYLLLSSA